MRESGFGLVTSTLQRIELPVPSSAFFLRSIAALARSRDPVSLRPEPPEGFLRIIIAIIPTNYLHIFFFATSSVILNHEHFGMKSRNKILILPFDEIIKLRERLESEKETWFITINFIFLSLLLM